MFTPSWLLVTGLCTAVLARADFGAIATAYTTLLEHSQKYKVCLQCDHDTIQVGTRKVCTPFNAMPAWVAQLLSPLQRLVAQWTTMQCAL
jgi:hypothetical protein